MIHHLESDPLHLAAFNIKLLFFFTNELGFSVEIQARLTSWLLFFKNATFKKKDGS